MKKIYMAALIFVSGNSLAQDQNINGNVNAGASGSYWQGFRSNAPSGTWGFQQSDRMMIGMGGNVYNRGFSAYSMGIFNGSTTKEDVYLYNQNSPTGDFLVLKNTGNVGIGVIDPSAPLHVNGIIRWGGISQNYFYSGQDGGGGYIEQVGNSPAETRIRIQTAKPGDFSSYSQLFVDPNQGFSFHTTGSANGNVGIGTTSPQYPLDLQRVMNGNYVARIINTSGASSADGGLIVETSTASAAKVLSLRTNGVENFSLDGTATAYFKGSVGIGTTQPDAKLTVKGKIHAEEVKVDLNVPGPDYVFEKDYNLKSLEQVEKYVSQNKHLPEIPSAKEMKAEGISMGDMQMKLLQKVEELTLYLIEQEKRNDFQEQQIKKLQKEVKQLKK